MAIVEMAKYISVGGRLTAGYGDAVGAAFITVKCVSADDGQLPSVPAKFAITV